MPWAVHLAADGFFDTIALDFDGPSTLEQATEALELLAGCGFNPVLTSSGTGHHVLVRLENPIPAPEAQALAEAMKDRWPSIDHGLMCNWRTGVIRPPGSPHQDGGVSTPIRGELKDFVSPTDPDALNRLHDTLGTSRRPHNEVRFHRLLTRGDTEGEFRSRSELQHSLAHYAVLAGWDFEHFLKEMLDPHNKGGARCQELSADGPRRAEADLRRSYNKAFQRITTRPDLRTLKQRLNDYSVHSRRQVGTGRTASTDLAVLEALCSMALSLRREKFTVSVRQLGEEAKVAKETAGRSLHRLVDKNLLTKTKPFVRNTPAEYQLVMPDMTITAPNESPNAYIHVSGGCVETVSVERLHDVFRWGSGLGHTAGEVWRNLRTDEPVTAVELTDIVDVHKSTTHRCLRKLREVGMAARTRDGWVRVERDLDEVAVELGVDGKTDQQRWVHELERDNWERYLAMPGPKVPSPDIVIRTKLWGRAAQAQTGRQNVATAPRATRAAEG